MKQLLCIGFFATSLSVIANEWYVDPVNGNDAYDGTSSNVVSDTVGPRRTLAGIMGKAMGGDTVWLLPGEYAEKTMTDTGDCNRRLQVKNRPNMRFRATAGRDKTFIVGGGGAEAVGCVRVDSTSVNCVFEGITFKDGAAPIGAGLRDHTKNCWVIGCRFTNCVASSTGGAMLQGKVSGTEFVDCGCENGAAGQFCYNTIAEFCSFRKTKSATGVAFTQGGKFYNCTIVGCRGGVFDGSVYTLYNTLVFGNERAGVADNGAAAAKKVSIYSSYLGTCKYVLGPEIKGNSNANGAAAEVKLVAAAAGDFRLADTSAVKTKGYTAYYGADYCADPQLPEGFVRKDVYGYPVPTTDTIALGCSVVDFPTQTFGCIGFETPMSVREFGDTVFCAKDSITPIGASSSFTVRPVLADDVIAHHLVDTKDADPAKVAAYPIPGGDGWFAVSAKATLTQNRMFDVQVATQVLYADDANGNDGWNGQSATYVSGLTGPKKTLSAATGEIVSDGYAIVFALPGTYDDGSSVMAGQTLPNRVVLPANTTLVSTDGPEKTFIVGTAGAGSEATFGNGPGAERCVYCADGARVCGFTITGGHTLQAHDGGLTADNCGGAIYAEANTARFEDCIISNNAALQGAIYSGKVIRCGVFGNASSFPPQANGNATPAGAAGDRCAWYGCVIDNNIGAGPLLNPSRIEFCTIGDGNFRYRTDTGAPTSVQVVFCEVACTMVNSVILGSKNTTYGRYLYVTRCLFRTGIDTAGWTSEPYNGNRKDCIMTDAANITVDANYRPVHGAYAGIDEGDLSLSDGTLFADFDVTGALRIQNGTIDIGAVEFDWRKRYARDLGSRATVTDASSEVTEVGSSVRIPSGSIAGTLRPGGYTANFTVTGGGLLVLTLGGAVVGTYSAADGAQSVTVEVLESANDFCFAFTPDAQAPSGYAELNRFRSTDGMVIYIR